MAKATTKTDPEPEAEAAPVEATTSDVDTEPSAAKSSESADGEEIYPTEAEDPGANFPDEDDDPAPYTAPNETEAEAHDDTPASVDDYLILDGPASFGPITVGGKRTRAKKGVPILVTDPAEQLALLKTRVFRAATAADLKPLKGATGPMTVDRIPDGGLTNKR